MRITAKMIRELSQQAAKTDKGTDHNEFIAKKLESYREIESALAYFRRQLAQLREKHLQESAIVQKKIDAVQAECPHPDIRCGEDPAGGSDRSDYCLICEKFL